MSVLKRSTKYHFRFNFQGKIYSGVCKDCDTKQKAEAYEKKQKTIVKGSLSEVNADKGVLPQVIKSLQIKLTGRAPIKIAIADAFELSLEHTRKQTSEKATDNKRSFWRDFTAFLKDKFPEVKNLQDVLEFHADAYEKRLREKGRYDKHIKDSKGKEYERKGNLSPKSANVGIMSVRQVFTVLEKISGIYENPFGKIKMEKNESVSREAFTKKERKLIFADENKSHFVYPLFVIGLSTGMREGDVATLKWDEIDFDESYIKRKTDKTGKVVEIPMITGLYNFMLDLKALAKDSPYVLPEHAKIYNETSDGISARIKSFLEGLGFETTRKIKGRTRLVSVRDFHSLRHTFCAVAGLARIPIVIVQSIMGHMTPEMTRHYQRHADLEQKTEALKAMPDFIANDGGIGFGALGNGTNLMLMGGNPKAQKIQRILNILDETNIEIVLKFATDLKNRQIHM